MGILFRFVVIRGKVGAVWEDCIAGTITSVSYFYKNRIESYSQNLVSHDISVVK